MLSLSTVLFYFHLPLVIKEVVVTHEICESPTVAVEIFPMLRLMLSTILLISIVSLSFEDTSLRQKSFVAV
jgi:hypothetical protein